MTAADKASFYENLIAEAKAVIDGEHDAIANLSNVSSLVAHALNGSSLHGKKTYNWVGFYLMRKGELVLGPFQGKVACIRIKPGRGVCGASVVRKAAVLVPNVHHFADHIACDSASNSNSELVLPLFSPTGDVIGVFDLDCEQEDGFTEEDQAGLEPIVRALEKECDWSSIY
ncbi:GAF domain-containing protein [Capsaspora owczarzaki ATCC 30864]|uniref:GAF domain-containing protein n=1 Tax=Capsaspora owczarzaki (strain ATCC 30864) TaxID=595528 RepID=A0A0D2VJ17_CAPO3|nr:GAF domain-containing protein [Capsaspora owczarzaki ATCC 30864]KJE89982.1 GAF domain-containing protein [Capsaspora owczarzaki ATCC 30864]|eukprot:XP_004349892.2 GAF domain-containing protein [Capsaspora owczarzaki ATCC 30864]